LQVILKNGLRVILAYILALAAWQGISLVIGASWLPGPLDILEAYLERGFATRLVRAYALTAARALSGFALGLAAGLGLGLAAGSRQYLNSVMEGVATIAASVPSVAWIPLLIAAMGISEFRLPITASFLCSFPPIFYQTLSAMRSIDVEELLVARTLGAKGFYLWRTIVFTFNLRESVSSS
jgi:ABC-type nitrate/sulfonate/bicarbonate transport system permease component